MGDMKDANCQALVGSESGMAVTHGLVNAQGRGRWKGREAIQG